MLVHLSIANVVLIEKLNLDFHTGFTVLTGETGSGKSILLDALGLALGTRADTSLIRTGEDTATVTAIFDISKLESTHPLWATLNQAHIPHPGAELIIRRQLSREQRGKIFLNDEPITLNLLKAVGHNLMNIHGQFEDTFTPEGSALLLDQFAAAHVTGFTDVYRGFECAFESWQAAKGALDAFDASLQAAQTQKAYLEFVWKELAPLKPEQDEETTLLHTRELYAHGGKATQAAEQGLEWLDKLNLDGLFKAEQTLARYQDLNHKLLCDAFACLSRASIDMQEGRSALEDILRDTQASARELSRIDDRLHLLRLHAKKFGVNPNALGELYERARTIQSSEAEHETKRFELNEACTLAYKEATLWAQKLTHLREQAAQTLTKAVSTELPDLKLENARFQVDIAPRELGPCGGDGIVLNVAMNPGQPLTPLHKTASGGELARLTLALKVATGHAAPILIFDEIDRGVSGSVATAIGKRLRRLGHTRQVFAITHSAQVAACANNHLSVSKTVTNHTTTTHVHEVSHNQRLKEIARLLAGDAITPASMAAAKQLLIC
jgi:DNA repair protein RecN (Recombination protein N)